MQERKKLENILRIEREYIQLKTKLASLASKTPAQTARTCSTLQNDDEAKLLHALPPRLVLDPLPLSTLPFHLRALTPCTNKGLLACALRRSNCLGLSFCPLIPSPPVPGTPPHARAAHRNGNLTAVTSERDQAAEKENSRARGLSKQASAERLGSKLTERTRTLSNQQPVSAQPQIAPCKSEADQQPEKLPSSPQQQTRSTKCRSLHQSHQSESIGSLQQKIMFSNLVTQKLAIKGGKGS